MFFVLISISACSETKELTQFDFNASFTKTLTVPLSENSTTFSGNLNLNLEDNENYSEYLGNIKAIEISDASYKFNNYVGAEDASGSITVKAAEQNFGPFMHNFFIDTQNNTVFELENTTKLDALVLELLDSNRLNFQFSGVHTPPQNGSLTIELNFKVKVTAQLL